MNALALAVLATVAPAADPPAGPVPVAHRGLFKHAPENTRAAFSACLSLQLGFELDVRRTRDGQLVVLHDPTVDRTTDGTGPVAGMSLRELRMLDAGRKFDPAFAGERVPALDEVFNLAAAHRRGPPLILLDLKIDDPELPGDIAKLAARHRLTAKVVCIGNAITSPELRRRLKEADPKLPVAVLADKPDDFPAALKDEHADWLYLRFVPSAEQTAAARAAGKRVLCVGPLFTGNEPDSWRKAAAAGADAVLTDYPLELRAALREPKKSP
jgi:glycerophosphoryl diester phosphodiesterase